MILDIYASRRLRIHASQCKVYLRQGFKHNCLHPVSSEIIYVACRLQHYHNYLRNADNAMTYKRIEIFSSWSPIAKAVLDECDSRTIASLFATWKELLNITTAHYMWDTTLNGGLILILWSRDMQKYRLLRARFTNYYAGHLKLSDELSWWTCTWYHMQRIGITQVQLDSGTTREFASLSPRSLPSVFSQPFSPRYHEKLIRTLLAFP